MPRDERRRQKQLMKKRSKEGELPEKEQITFGKDGKPFFVAGPDDNVGRIMRQLEKTAGPGNFHFLAGFGDMGMDLDDLDFVDLE
jgi:hypothetical protein